eukprot:Platyproteum_vivax@DN4096_c0_g1_i1.p1
MKYRSTRGGVAELSFVDAVLSGLADDGGLLTPDSIPMVEQEVQKVWKTFNYHDLCFSIMRLFIDKKEVSDDHLKQLIQTAYSQFRHSEITPVNKLKDFWMLELFHGPTYAFKDVALQFLGCLFDYLLQQRNEKMLVVGATSGDTGSAAIAALSGKNNTSCAILFPTGRTSEIQRLQMTTCPYSNVNCLSVEGTFDDCQSIVKDLFQSDLKKSMHLGAVNSINWARILAQIVYYWYASFRILEKESGKSLVDFVVPTGNFGNILAGYYARQMGAPIGNLVIASNSNDILTRFRETGCYELKPVVATMSPSMDIQVSSNFERFLYHVSSKDHRAIKASFSNLNASSFRVGDTMLTGVQRTFFAYSCTETETKKGIRQAYDESGVVLDPHTSVAFICAKKYHAERQGDTETQPRVQKAAHNPCCVVATAHFGKFADEVTKILGTPATVDKMPADLLDLRGRRQYSTPVSASTFAVSRLLKQMYHPEMVSWKDKWLFLLEVFQKRGPLGLLKLVWNHFGKKGLRFSVIVFLHVLMVYALRLFRNSRK